MTVLSPRPKKLSGISVLVLEDEGDARELLTYFLEDSGATVMAYATVPEALAALNHLTPDVLLVDIGLREHSGYVFIGRVRALDDAIKRSLPAIALTAFATATDRHTALTSGFQMFVSKPYDTRELLGTIANAARVKRDAA